MREQPNIVEQVKDVVVVGVSFIDGSMSVGSCYNAAVRHVHADFYLFHDVHFRAEDPSIYTRAIPYMSFSHSADCVRLISCTYSAITAVNGFANTAWQDHTTSAVLEQRAQRSNVAIEKDKDGWTDLRVQISEEVTTVRVDPPKNIFTDGLWEIKASLVHREDEPNMTLLFLRRETQRCPNCNFNVTCVHLTHCCDMCKHGLGHSSVCARAVPHVPFLINRSNTLTKPVCAKRTVLLCLYGLHRNFEATAEAVYTHIIQPNQQCNFTIMINTSLVSTSRRDNGFGGGPIRRPNASAEELKSSLQACYKRFGTIADIVLDDSTHFKWHPGHKDISRDKDEPITYRIWSTMERVRERFDTYIFLRMDVQPRAAISLEGYDDNTFRIISSEGKMNCFFHDRNWDFCWVGGYTAMRLWVYPVREFSTATERGLHRNVTSISREFASWRECRNSKLSSLECIDIMNQVGCRGNDRSGAWIETHNRTQRKTRWKPLNDSRVSPDGRFESEAGGPGWGATFENSIFQPDRGLLGAEPVQRLGNGKCVAPTWCRHGSTFTYETEVHWRSEQYCRIIKNMHQNGCTFGFRDNEGEFLWLRRDV